MQMSLRYILIIVAVAMLFESCRTTSHPGVEENKDPQPKTGRVLSLSAQLIIKFKDAKTDPTQVDFLKQLSRDANATLHYFRPMSGGAHVFSVVSIADEKKLAVIIQRLSKRADIEYVEEDSIMVHQQ